LDGVFQNGGIGFKYDTLIRIYPAPTNVPYWFVEKKDCYRVSQYQEQYNDALLSGYIDEELEVRRRGVLEGIPGGIPSSSDFQLVEKYKRLEKYAALPMSQDGSDNNPSDNAPNKTRTPKKNKPSKQKVCKGICDFADTLVENKILTWLNNNETCEENTMTRKWLKK
jgi:hypothetical protein